MEAAPKQERFYITTSIAYVNAPPHIGFAMELLEADVIARYRRFEGDDVFFLTGTDDNALKIGRAAIAAGKDFKEFVDENAKRFEDLQKLVNTSADDFIHTSDPVRHWPGAQELWRRLVQSGDIYKSTYNGLYCIGHEAFVTDKDLVDGKCPDHDKAPEAIEEENYFFRLSRFTNDIKKLVESNKLHIIPEKRRNEVLSFLSEGLEDISFSRPAKDIPWGIPVPGDASQSMYVWCDALANYITALGFGNDDKSKFGHYWPASVHVIGKDIVRFHALIWIGMLLAAGLQTPKSILVHAFIVSGGKKMSKSLGNVVDPFAVGQKYGADALRYFLLREIPIFEDGDFTIERFEAAYNANLANGIGNLVSRTAAMVESYFDSTLIKPADEILLSVPIKTSIDIMETGGDNMKTAGMSIGYIADNSIVPAYKKAMKEYRLNEAADTIWQLIGILDKYIQDYEPFKLVKTDKDKTQAVLWQVAYGLEVVARLMYPFMPETAMKMDAVLGVDSRKPEERNEYVIKKGEAIFPRLESGIKNKESSSKS